MKKFINFWGSWTGIFLGIFLFIFFIAQLFIIPSTSMNPALKVGDRILALKFSYGVPIPRLPVISQRILPDFFGTGHLISWSGPKRNDVVVFNLPLAKRVMFVKRCVAVGGDEILYTDKNTYFKFNSDYSYMKDLNLSSIIEINGEKWIKNPYKYANYKPEEYSSFEKMKNIMINRQNEEVNLTSNKNMLNMEPIFINEFKSEVFHLKDKRFNAFYVKVPKNKYYMMGDNRDNSWDSRFWGALDYKYIEGKMFLIVFSSELRNYKQVKSGILEGLSDQGDLKEVCRNIDLNSRECEEKWNKYKGHVRKERIFKLVD